MELKLIEGAAPYCPPPPYDADVDRLLKPTPAVTDRRRRNRSDVNLREVRAAHVRERRRAVRSWAVSEQTNDTDIATADELRQLQDMVSSGWCKYSTAVRNRPRPGPGLSDPLIRSPPAAADQPAERPLSAQSFSSASTVWGGVASLENSTRSSSEHSLSPETQTGLWIPAPPPGAAPNNAQPPLFTAPPELLSYRWPPAPELDDDPVGGAAPGAGSRAGPVLDALSVTADLVVRSPGRRALPGSASNIPAGLGGQPLSGLGQDAGRAATAAMRPARHGGAVAGKLPRPRGKKLPEIPPTRAGRPIDRWRTYRSRDASPPPAGDAGPAEHEGLVVRHRDDESAFDGVTEEQLQQLQQYHLQHRLLFQKQLAMQRELEALMAEGHGSCPGGVGLAVCEPPSLSQRPSLGDTAKLPLYTDATAGLPGFGFTLLASTEV